MMLCHTDSWSPLFFADYYASPLLFVTPLRQLSLICFAIIDAIMLIYMLLLTLSDFAAIAHVIFAITYFFLRCLIAFIAAAITAFAFAFDAFADCRLRHTLHIAAWYCLPWLFFITRFRYAAFFRAFAIIAYAMMLFAAYDSPLFSLRCWGFLPPTLLFAPLRHISWWCYADASPAAEAFIAAAISFMMIFRRWCQMLLPPCRRWCRCFAIAMLPCWLRCRCQMPLSPDAFRHYAFADTITSLISAASMMIAACQPAYAFQLPFRHWWLSPCRHTIAAALFAS